MPATATYRIGPSDFFTPGDLSADADTLNGQIELLDEQLGDGDPPLEFQDQWTHFQGSWATFYNEHFGGFFSSLFTALNDANRDDLIRYENQFTDFERSAKAYGAELVAPVGPSSGSKDTLGDHLTAQGLPSSTTLVVIAVALVAVLIAWKATT